MSSKLRSDDLEYNLTQSALSGPFVEIKVGPDSISFTAHQNLLCSESHFFAAACNVPWFAKDGVLKLPEDEPYIFAMFLKLMYSNGYSVDLKAAEPEMVRDQFKLYVLADKLQATACLKILEQWFKNNLFKLHLHEGRDKIVGICEAQYIYMNTSATSELRRIISQAILAAVGREMVDIMGFSQVWIETPEFASDLLSEVARGFVYATKIGFRLPYARES